MNFDEPDFMGLQCNGEIHSIPSDINHSFLHFRNGYGLEVIEIFFALQRQRTQFHPFVEAGAVSWV